MKNDSMIAARKAVFVPALKERGFEGWLPRFPRIQATRIDLLTVPFNKWGGSLIIEVAKCPPEGITTAGGNSWPQTSAEPGMCPIGRDIG